jgi:hypothetical protein
LKKTIRANIIIEGDAKDNDHRMAPNLILVSVNQIGTCPTTTMSEQDPEDDTQHTCRDIFGAIEIAVTMNLYV